MEIRYSTVIALPLETEQNLLFTEKYQGMPAHLLLNTFTEKVAKKVKKVEHETLCLTYLQVPIVVFTQQLQETKNRLHYCNHWTHLQFIFVFICGRLGSICS